MIRFLTVLLGMLLPGLLYAQTLTIRNGEHDDFTRLVLAIPVGADWQIDNRQDSIRITVEGVTEADIDGFFNRIPRSRIAEIATTDGPPVALTLGLTCACRAEAFLWRPDRLVIDVVDGAPDPRPAPDPVDLPLLTARADLPLPRMAFEVAPFAMIAEAERQLAALTGAAEDLPLPLDPPVEMTPPDDGATDGPGIAVRTGGDDDLARLASELTQNCPKPEDYEVADWGDGEAFFSEQIARSRARISLERDRTDSDAVLALARLYVFFGFGQEAVDTLTIDGRQSAERAAVRDLAAVVDGRGTSVTLFPDLALCPGPVALWALLATPEKDAPDGIDAQAITRAFKRLPLHLQRHLGPMLAVRMEMTGALDAAETTLSAAQDPSLPITEKAVVAAARIDAAQDRPDDAEARLSDFITTEPDVSPETMVSLTTLQISQNLPIPSEQIGLIDALLFERSDPQPELEAARIRALVHRGEHALAAASLPRAADIDLAALRDAVLLAAVADADDVVFLDLAYSPLPERAGFATQNAVAQRLIAGGFGERAADLLWQDGSREAMAERRYLRAEAAVAMGDTLLAERHLSGITTDRAAAILDRARFGVEPADGAELADWRAGNWAGLATSEDDLLQSASAALLSEAPAIDIAAAPLRDSAALLEDAAATRQTVEALLGRFPIDADAN